MQEWKKEIENNADRDVLIYLVGNFADLGETEEREVAKDEGEELMKEKGLHHHMEVSALNGMNIDALFATLTKHLFLEHNGQLGEFKVDDSNTLDNNRNSSIHFKNELKNSRVDLYKP